MTRDEFTRAYVEAALWSTNDESDPETGGDPLDKNYGPEDIAPETMRRIEEDCAAFQRDNAADLEAKNCLAADHRKQGGHDFWLTRGRHGCGFWDGDWAEPAATRLTAAAHALGEFYLYVGDDGKIYH